MKHLLKAEGRCSRITASSTARLLDGRLLIKLAKMTQHKLIG